MSEPEKLNFDDSAGGRSIDPEQILLCNLQPQALEVNRDELFFQAGFAAGISHRSRFRLFWPSATAALLLVSIGLGSVLAWQVNSASALRMGVAAQQNSSDHEAARLADGERADSGELPSDQRQRVWQRLASLTPLPAGYLTARGWVETPTETGNNGTKSSSSIEPAKSDNGPQRPATYFELMRLQREG